MKWVSHNKTLLVTFFLIIIFIAGLLDLKYEGIFYQMLPKTVQSFIHDIL